MQGRGERINARESSAEEPLDCTDRITGGQIAELINGVS